MTSVHGVILDSDQIPEGISKKFIRYPGEAQEKYNLRVTHGHFQSQKIFQIGDLSPIRNLTVLYLYDNRITKIEHLDQVPNLTMLYLQKNRITTIENLDHLKKLKKLYLSNNKISVIENLEELKNLTELHVDNQSLSDDQNLVFDPKTCAGLAKRLQVLNTSGNRMIDLCPLHELSNLSSLNTAENNLNDLAGAVEILAQMPALKWLDLRGNPFTKQLRYREHVIGACRNSIIEVVDGKTVDPNSRIMMKNLAKAREANEGSRSISHSRTNLNSATSLSTKKSSRHSTANLKQSKTLQTHSHINGGSNLLTPSSLGQTSSKFDAQIASPSTSIPLPTKLDGSSSTSTLTNSSSFSTMSSLSQDNSIEFSTSTRDRSHGTTPNKRSSAVDMVRVPASIIEK